MTILIGFASRRFVGKDTCADYLIQKYNSFYEREFFVKDSFAFSLKASVKALFGFSDEQLNDPLMKQEIDTFWNITPRMAMQKLGTNFVRSELGEDFWIRSLSRRVIQREEAGINSIISDVRFCNEAEFLRSRGGIVVRVNRNKTFDPLIDNHPSETSMDSYKNFDFVLDNNGSFEHLYQQIDMMMQEIANGL